MALLFFWTPDRGNGVSEGGYATPVGNIPNGLTGLGFVDSGLVTAFGDPIYKGTVNATQTAVVQPTADPSQSIIDLLGRSINRVRPASPWVMADVGTWARGLPPGSLLYVTFR